MPTINVSSEVERLQQLRDAGLIGANRDADLLQVCKAASVATRMPVVLAAIDDNGQTEIAASVGFEQPACEIVSNDLLKLACEYPIAVADTNSDPRFISSPAIKSFAAFPLLTRAGVSVGAICSLGKEPHQLTADAIELLSTLATIATSCVVAHRTAHELQRVVADRDASQKELWHAAYHDPLTGLPNLKHFRHLAHLLIPTAAADHSVTLMLVDLDDFKGINDRWGHLEGDSYLKLVAQKLLQAAGDRGLVARIGGDEFAIIMATGAHPAATIADTVTRVRAHVGEVSNETGQRGGGKVSLGIAIAPAHGTTLDTLYKAADSALYEVKKAGRDGFRVFDEETDQARVRRHAERVSIVAAMEKGQFQPFYQPLINLKTGAISGFEALARWMHPLHGVLFPAQFMAVFDNCDACRKLTQTIVEQVISDIVRWTSRGLSFGRVAINLSPFDLRDPKLPGDFLSRLAQASVDPRSICLEVTESVVMGSAEGQVHRTLATFKDAGISIALDDFGTGHAGLLHLRNWPVDRLKIDQAFVKECLTNHGDLAIVRATVGLAHALGLGVTAEGIETAEQAELLKALNCDTGQGFHFGRAIPASDVEKFLATRACA